MADSAFGFDAPEDSLGFLLWQATVVWQREIRKALEPHGVSHSQFVLLAILLWHREQGETVNQTLLARQSKLDKMTVSKALKPLVAEGLVRRREHPHDPRANAVELSDKGAKLARQLVPVVEAVDARFFAALKKSKQKELAALLSASLRDK